MNPKQLSRVLAALVAAAMTAALMAPLAQAETPAPGYGQFAGCPSPKSENPGITNCLRTLVTGGHFKMGNKDVPITEPIELVGGTELGENFSFNSKGGLLPAKQRVPGGVVGLTGLDWLLEFLGGEALELYAVTELAGTPKILSVEHVQLPIKVHLINPVLGNNCRVGSNSSPINLDLTTGTTSPPGPNEPITGKSPEFVFDPATHILHANNGTFVDNSFAAPGANGCVLTLFGFIPVSLNEVINLASGLPSPAGSNETVQNFDLEVVASENVYP